MGDAKMSMVFNFRMLSDEDDNFVRDYEVPYDMTLKDFHRFICDDLQYDAMEMASFFKSDKSWQKLKEFTLVDMGIHPQDDLDDDLMPVAMEQVLLGQIIRQEHDRLLLVYDLFEDRAFFIELMSARKTDPDMEYPRVVFANGEAPDQFDAEKNAENKSIFDEAMDDWGSYEGDDNYDDEY